MAVVPGRRGVPSSLRATSGRWREGTLDILLAVRGGSRHTLSVTGPLGDPVDASWGLLSDGTAVVEMAQASGLSIVAACNHPLRATTRGTGELIGAALDAGADRIIVGVGGGTRQLTAVSARSKHWGGHSGADVLVACDVGIQFLDAARRFGPQKGATPEQIGFLSRRLVDIAKDYDTRTGVEIMQLPGSGAAGGLGGGLAALATS